MRQCLTICATVLFAAFGCYGETVKEFSRKDYPLFKGLDTCKMKTSTRSEEAQRYFNQGLALYYGYNYPEAERSFRAASLLDPECGMHYWGCCLSLCDCIDNPGDKWHTAAQKAYREAIAASNQGSEKERGLIQALAMRFEQKGYPPAIFTQNMKRLYYTYPDDPDIAAIYCNVGVKTINLYKGLRDGNPSGEAEELIKAFEEEMKKHPDHPGLNHFYIHAMEAAGTPEKALDAAIRLDGAVPGSGHLQHMPAHIYFYYGRYHDATEANIRGIEADDQMFRDGGIKDPEFAGFYLHNYYFLFDSMMMEGRAKEAIEAAQNVVKRLKEGDLPSNPYLRDVYYGIPSLLMARTGKWGKLPSEPPIPENLNFAKGMRAYALGLAAIRKKDEKEADKNLELLSQAIENYEKGKERGPYSPSLAKILQIAALDLGGQIDVAHGHHQRQIESLYDALAIEDTLDFHMLPWYMYMRHALGDALLEADMPYEAEQVYREDLEKHPNNGWALYGLVRSLKRQSRIDEAEESKEEFDVAWQYADINLSSSRF